MKKSIFLLFALIFVTGSVFAQAPPAVDNAPWKTYALSGFNNLDHVEIAATANPVANPAMDNLVFVFGGAITNGKKVTIKGTNVTTMAFEVASPGSQILPATPYSEGGYTLVGNGLSEDGIFSPTSPNFELNSNGTDIFGWCGGCPGLITLSISRADSALFSMSSIDLSNLDSASFAAGDFSIAITGYDSNGGVIATQVITISASAALGPAVAIPTLSGWALIGLSLLMLLVAFRAGRKVFQT